MDRKEWSPSNLLDVFGDPIARTTLVIASERRVAVKDLADELGVSHPTIYRRIHPLVDSNLLKEYQHVDSNGNSRSEYETTLEEVTFSIDADGYVVDIEVRQDLAESVDSTWNTFGSSTRGDIRYADDGASELPGSSDRPDDFS